MPTLCIFILSFSVYSFVLLGSLLEVLKTLSFRHCTKVVCYCVTSLANLFQLCVNQGFEPKVSAITPRSCSRTFLILVQKGYILYIVTRVAWHRRCFIKKINGQLDYESSAAAKKVDVFWPKINILRHSIFEFITL